MNRRTLRAALLAALLVLACNGKEQNPALPTDPGHGTAIPPSLTLTGDAAEVSAGATTAVMLHVAAKNGDGTAVADGTSVTLNTNLGNFGVDASGKPVQLTHASLSAGRADVAFYAGPDIGVANVLAQAGTANAAYNVKIVTPPVAPQADFTFSASGLSVLFTDASAGAVNSRRWQFGDGLESGDTNPFHTYGASATFTVTLTVSGPGGASSKSKFVTVSAGRKPTSLFGFEVLGRQVNFVDKSTGGATSWSWSFGDGGSSAARNPVYIYATAGHYTVTLTASNSAGSDSSSQVVAIDAGQPPVSLFSFTTTGRQVNFVDKSTNSPQAWIWNFGDSTSSNMRNPVHVYAAPGAYTVSLTAMNGAGYDVSSQVVTISAGDVPAADFSSAANGLTVNFIDKSTNAPTTWSWNFGDNTTSSLQNPVHTYGASGTYTVTLTVGNAAGANSKSQFVTVSAGAAPQAAFTFTPSGLQVNFVDRSTGSPTSWSWNFGDNTSSSQQNPIKVYQSPGTYTVTLVVRNAAGSTSTSQVVTVQ